jgi:hypothetical protein
MRSAAGCRIAATFISGNSLLTMSAVCPPLDLRLFMLRYAADLSHTLPEVSGTDRRKTASPRAALQLELPAR